MSDSPPPDLDDLFRAIGELTVSWAYLEATIDVCVQEVYYNQGGSYIEAEMPRTALSRKLEFLEKCFNVAPLCDRFPGMKDVLDRVSGGATIRNAIIHGVLLDLDGYLKTGTATAVSHVRRKGRSMRQTLKTDHNRIRQLAEFAVKLSAFYGFITRNSRSKREARTAPTSRSLNSL